MTPDFLIVGNPIGIQDKWGHEICFGDTVKIHIGKPNDGYRVVYLDGSFCLIGGNLGAAMSFIKFRDELIEGRITGTPNRAPYQSFLEVIGRDYMKNMPSGPNFGPSGATGGVQSWN